jgi:Tol biopolymer transport system component
MPRLSPDGARLAVTISESQTGNLDVWQIDLAHAITTRFTFHPNSDIFPVWSPDGKQIVYSSFREGNGKLYVKAASGTGNDERIGPQSTAVQIPYDWSADGRHILYEEAGTGTGSDLWVLPITGERKPVPFLQTAFNETQGQFSPDGHWVAYISDESGRNEVYVRSFTGISGKFQVSQNGGVQPRWRGDGKELFYLAPDGKMMVVTVKAAAETFARETPRVLFDARSFGAASMSIYSYDVTRDGQRFLGISVPEGDTTQPLTLITNWQARLRK